jgi:hypothetical protein
MYPCPCAGATKREVVRNATKAASNGLGRRSMVACVVVESADSSCVERGLCAYARGETEAGPVLFTDSEWWLLWRSPRQRPGIAIERLRRRERAKWTIAGVGERIDNLQAGGVMAMPCGRAAS